MITNEGDVAIDFRGKIALTSLPLSAEGMKMFAGAGEACGGTLAAGATLRGPGSGVGSVIELAAADGCVDSGAAFAVFGAPIVNAVEPLGSSGGFSESDLDSFVGDEFGSFAEASAEMCGTALRALLGCEERSVDRARVGVA